MPFILYKFFVLARPPIWVRFAILLYAYIARGKSIFFSSLTSVPSPSPACMYVYIHTGWGGRGGGSEYVIYYVVRFHVFCFG